MNPLFAGPRLALALTLASLGAGAASAAEGDYVVQTLGDTSVEVLDADTFSAYSAAKKPAIAVEGETVRTGIEHDDVLIGGPQSVAVSVEVGACATFTLTFEGEAQAAAPKIFDGRLLTSRDLSKDRTYRPQAALSDSAQFSYQLFNGGVFVGAFESDDGVAPFLLDGIPDAFDAEPVAAASGPGGQIEIHSFHFGGTTATLDSGERFAVDTVVVRGTHEVGHLIGLGHDHGIRRKSVSAVGVDTLVLDVDAEGSMEAIEALVFDQGAFDVRGNVADELAASTALSVVTARFQPAPGMLQRVRVRVRGGTWGNPPWGLDRIDQRLDVPTMGQQIVYEYQLERRAANGTTTIASSGYIRVKKLNSG